MNGDNKEIITTTNGSKGFSFILWTGFKMFLSLSKDLVR